MRGVKILVTRYWPRGHKREEFDQWARELAPSLPLFRDWRGRRITWEEYERRFRDEILNNPQAIEKMREVKQLSEDKDVYLVCHETEYPCHRYVLMNLIQGL